MIQKSTDISVLFVLTTKFFLIINLVSVVYKKKRYLLLTRSNHRRVFTQVIKTKMISERVD